MSRTTTTARCASHGAPTPGRSGRTASWARWWLSWLLGRTRRSWTWSTTSPTAMRGEWGQGSGDSWSLIQSWFVNNERFLRWKKFKFLKNTVLGSSIPWEFSYYSNDIRQKGVSSTYCLLQNAKFLWEYFLKLETWIFLIVKIWKCKFLTPLPPQEPLYVDL